MKSQFSTQWLSSKQPRKQRKFRANAPLHIRHKFLSSNLSKSLKEKYGKRNLPLRKGDEVLIMRGAFKKKKAKVSSVDHKKIRIVLEGIQRAKKDGTKVNVYFDPSVLQIVSLNLEDSKRSASLKQKSEKEIKQEKSNEEKSKKQGE